MNKLKAISNENKLNEIEQSVYDKFNNFIFSDDLKLTGKLLHRFEHFLNVKDLPGDIVEVGVFKGSGISTFMKFVEIYCPNSNKKVIGFDIFDTVEAEQILEKDGGIDKESMFVVYDRVGYEDLTLESVTNRLNQTKISSDKFKLIKGDVQYSIPKFLEENQGFRVSLLYIDVFFVIIISYGLNEYVGINSNITLLIVFIITSFIYFPYNLNYMKLSVSLSLNSYLYNILILISIINYYFILILYKYLYFILIYSIFLIIFHYYNYNHFHYHV